MIQLHLLALYVNFEHPSLFDIFLSTPLGSWFVVSYHVSDTFCCCDNNKTKYLPNTLPFITLLDNLVFIRGNIVYEGLKEIEVDSTVYFHF